MANDTVKIDPDEVQRLLTCIKFNSPKLVIADPADTIAALCAYFFETEKLREKIDEVLALLDEPLTNQALDILEGK